MIQTVFSPGIKPRQPTKVSVKPFKKLFPKNTPTASIEKTLLAALKLYFDAGNRVVDK